MQKITKKRPWWRLNGTAGAEMPLTNDIIRHPQHTVFENALLRV
jgi:hypothetical protein